MKTNEVFGVSNVQIITYVERAQVDSLFIDGLARNKHIIIYGSSKQGKTALTNKHLKEEDYIRVNCSCNSSTVDLYKSVIRQLGIEFEEVKETSSAVGGKAGGSISAKVKIPIVGEIGATGEIGGTHDKSTKRKFKTVAYNFELAQDISELLRSVKFSKRIILENFHYLSDDSQKQLAVDLRVFEDYNILFIILGIWREKNRLSQFNGDLLDRITEIPVEPWDKDDLIKITKKGEPLLNVSFNEIIEQLIGTCFDSVGVFQELCKEVCYAAGIGEKTNERKILKQAHLSQAISKKNSDYSSRHIRCLEIFVEQSAKGSDEIPLYIPYYFIKVLFSTPFDQITAGLKRKYLHDKIREIHHRATDVRSSDIGYFLKTLISNQIKKKIEPPIFDYDQSTNSVKVIDSTFYFFIRNCNKEETFEDIPIPPNI